MIIFRAKKDRPCKKCKTTIFRNELVTMTYKLVDGRRFTFFYHAKGCYPEHWLEKYSIALDKADQKWANRKPVGKQKVYKDITESRMVHRIKSLILYHTNKGNTVRVEELSKQLNDILSNKVSCNMYTDGRKKKVEVAPIPLPTITEKEFMDTLKW